MTVQTVFIGMPHYSAVNIGAARGLYLWATQHKCNVIPVAQQSSLLTNCFNILWCMALNARYMAMNNPNIGITHFAMIHADVSPERWWLDTLLAELVARDADVVSTVIPMKSPAGLTSTGVDNGRIRRLTMREVMKLPETFSIGDVPGVQADDVLLVNTGLWVCNFRRPWVEEMCFTQGDAIVRREDGQFIPTTSPEDWNFSRFLARHNCKVFATRKVKVQHWGENCWSNETAWGEWQTDKEYAT